MNDGNSTGRSCSTCRLRPTCQLVGHSPFQVMGASRMPVSPMLSSLLPMPCAGELYQPTERVRPAARLFGNWAPEEKPVVNPGEESIIEPDIGEKGLPR